MFVTGRVLDPAGRPVGGATIAVYARSLASTGALLHPPRNQAPIGDGRADGSGRFRIDAPRTSSSHHEAFGAIVMAPGHGANWVGLDPDADEPTAAITLGPEQLIHGRLFDLQGRPVPNVTLAVASIRPVRAAEPARVRARFDGVVYSWRKVTDLPAWPKPVTTDPEGHYTLRGLGRDQEAVLTVHDPRFALQRIPIRTNDASEAKPTTAALIPAQIITGQVTYADTGKVVPHATLEVMAIQGRVGIPSDFETDDQGRFRLNPPPADRSYGVRAYPPAGQPYLSAHRPIEWPKGAIEQTVDLALPRGVLIRGKVTEEGSGKPIPGATVALVARGEPPGGQNLGYTAADGTFQFGAKPSPGYLFIRAPDDDYVLGEIGNRMVSQGEPGGFRLYAHAHRFLDLKPGAGSQEVDIVLRRGATVTGPVIGPVGQPVRDAWIFSRAILDPKPGVSRTWIGRFHGKVHNGRFELRGLDPDSEVPVYFLDPNQRLGAVVILSGKSAGSTPVNVRLERCGAAVVRFVDSGGKPVTGRLPNGTVEMVVTPGPPYSRANNPAGLAAADGADLGQVDTVNYQVALESDTQGRLTLPALIPGANYRIIDWPAIGGAQTSPQVRKEFTVKPGETLEIGDILIEKPR
jgi:hypothetical protein